MSDATEYPNYNKPCSICAQPMGLFAGFDGERCNVCWIIAHARSGPVRRPAIDNVPQRTIEYRADPSEYRTELSPSLGPDQARVEHVHVPRATVRYRLTRPNAKAPTYATTGASGMDGYVAAITGHPSWVDGFSYYTLDPSERILCHLGIACEIPPGLELQVRPRSGLALKQGVAAMFGTVDSDYRGEIGATLVNLGSEPVALAIGDRVCQLVLAPVVRAEMVLVEELGSTERGSNGFGSSGR